MNITLPPNWKTSVAGLIASLGSAALAFIQFAAVPPYNVHFPPVVLALAAFAAIGGLAGLGLAAKDHNVTGGTTVQPGIPVAAVSASVPATPQLPVATGGTSAPPVPTVHW